MGIRMHYMPITVASDGQKEEQGKVVWTIDGPHIEGCSVHATDTYEVDRADIIHLVSNATRPEENVRYRVIMAPFARRECPFDFEGSAESSFYPPATDNWFERVQKGKQRAILFAQHILDSKKKWLTILDPASGNIALSAPVNPYETEFLLIEGVGKYEWYMGHAHFREKQRQEVERWFEEIFALPPPTWDQLHRICKGVAIPGLEIKATMGETVEQLIPPNIPERSKREFMFYIGWSLSEQRKMNIDPLDLNYRLNAALLLRNLIFYDLIHHGEKDVDLLPFMHGIPWSGLEKAADHYESLVVQIGHLDTQRDFSLDYLQIVRQLSQDASIPRGLPVTREDAKHSEKAWRLRAEIVANQLRFRGFLNYPRIGMRDVVYIGRAYQWPHRHTRWAGPIKDRAQNTLSLHLMVFPHHVADEVTEQVHNARGAKWSFASSNLHYLDPYRLTLTNPKKPLMESVKGSSSLASLEKEFDWTTTPLQTNLSPEHLKVMDSCAHGLFVGALEQPDEDEELDGIPAARVNEILTELREKHIATFSYMDTFFQRTHRREIMEAVMMDMRGDSERVLSVVRGLLKYAVTSEAYVFEEGAFTISRLPLGLGEELAEAMRMEGMEAELYRLVVSDDCRLNIHRRLYKGDGKWDDDATGFLSQGVFRRGQQ